MQLMSLFDALFLTGHVSLKILGMFKIKFNKDISRKVEGKLAGRVCTVKQVLAKNRRPVR